MKLEGRSTQQICDELEIRPRTLYVWFSDPLVKAELEAGQRQLNGLVAERLAAAACSALSSLQEIITSTPEEPITHDQRLQASKQILALVPADLGPPPEPDEWDQICSIIKEMTEDELDEFIRRCSVKAPELDEQAANGLP